MSFLYVNPASDPGNKFSAKPLSDQLAISELKEAVLQKNISMIESCMRSITTFDSKAPQEVIDRYVNLYWKLFLAFDDPQYTTELQRAAYSLLKTCPTLAYEITHAIEKNTGRCRQQLVANALLRLFYAQNDRDMSLFLTDLMNKLTICCSSKAVFLLQFVTICSEGDARATHSAYELMNREEFYEGVDTLPSALRSVEPRVDQTNDKYPQYIAHMLKGALTTQNPDLLFCCVCNVYSHFFPLSNVKNIDNIVQNFFKTIYNTQKLEGMQTWLARQLVELATHCEGLKNHKKFAHAEEIRSGFFFLYHFLEQSHPEAGCLFEPILAIIGNLSQETKSTFFCNVLVRTAYIDDKNVLQAMYNLISTLYLENDQHVHRQLIAILPTLQHASRPNGPNLFELWLDTIQSPLFVGLSSSLKEHPMITFLRAYLASESDPEKIHKVAQCLMLFGEQHVIELCVRLCNERLEHLFVEKNALPS